MRLPFVCALLALVATIGCARGDAFGGDGGVGIYGDGAIGPDGTRGMSLDAFPPGYDTGTANMCERSCGPTELCGAMNEGNGVDDNCNGTVDEGCMCPAINVTRPCFLGPPDRRNIGACADGVMACTEFLTWSACSGGQSPTQESCDGADNDCNGSIDDGLASCATALTCPGAQTTTPLNTFALSGSAIFPGTAASYRWTIECPPTVASCPMPRMPTAKDTDVYFVQSGSYRVKLDITEQSGSTHSCNWVVRVEGVGLRVELQWDTQGEGRGDTDVDLHLHRRSGASPIAPESAFFSDDDCYYGNCKASSLDETLTSRWTLPATTDLTACNRAPHGEGAEWMTHGSCANPRLDVDVIRCVPTVTDPTSDEFCAPENINVDNPPLGQPYRILVNYYSAHGHTGETNPTVTIFCNGEQRAMLTPPNPLRIGGSGFETNDNWLVADVVFVQGECGRVECRVQPLGMIQQKLDFGPPWTF